MTHDELGEVASLSRAAASQAQLRDLATTRARRVVRPSLLSAAIGVAGLLFPHLAHELLMWGLWLALALGLAGVATWWTDSREARRAAAEFARLHAEARAKGYEIPAGGDPEAW